MVAILNRGLPEFRDMRHEDLPLVMAIEQNAYRHCWTEGIFKDCIRVGYHCQIMEIDRELVAYAVMSTGAGEAHLLNLCVNPQLQGQGLGRAMLNHMLDLARRLYVELMLLEVRPSNVHALKLYESVGFYEVGVRKAYYPGEDGREDALILALGL